MRYYFNLVKGYEVIPDDQGVEAPDPDEARLEALRTAEELRSEDPTTAKLWKGWKLAVTTAFGVVAFIISLD